MPRNPRKKRPEYAGELRVIRAELGWTQAQFAEKLGVLVGSYSCWERLKPTRQIEESTMRLARMILAEEKRQKKQQEETATTS